ncbi:hypothetical protein [Methanosarcina barkeri]|nr:hypothetical protein [Methanosarcina barkeri]
MKSKKDPHKKKKKKKDSRKKKKKENVNKIDQWLPTPFLALIFFSFSV